MLETAMLKVFATDTLWRIINDTIQIFGGKAYFTDEPYERMMRDARINMIGEGANDVLRAFVALVGMRDVGLELKGVLDALSNPLKHFAKIGGFAGRKLEGMFRSPEVRVHHGELQPDADRLGSLVGDVWLERGTPAADLSRRYCRTPISSWPHRRRRDRIVCQRLRPAPA